MLKLNQVVGKTTTLFSSGKKLTAALICIFAFSAQSIAGNPYIVNGYGDAFIFDELGVTFSVYPDGEFDFYIPPANGGYINTPHVNVSFNSGYNYNPFVQYDDFGAVVQVENIGIWYDHFGRVTQIGNVPINYRNRRLSYVGGLHVFYNHHGVFSHTSGFINRWNPHFAHRPFYVSFARPVGHFSFVRHNPYRAHYRPIRHTYYRPYTHNARHSAATVGRTYRRGGYGVTNGYAQTRGYGETAITRTRRTVSASGVQPRTTGRTNRSSETARPTGTRSVNRTTSSSTSPSVSRSARTNQVTTTQPRATRPVSVNRNTHSAKPASSARTSTRSNSSVRPRTTSRSSSVVKPRTATTTRSSSRPAVSSARSATHKARTASGSSSKKILTKGRH